MAFVLPNWADYRFYNWQMSVTRKPEYSVGALADRASWLPLVQSIFSRMWLELLRGRMRTAGHRRALADGAARAERLLVLWVIVGLAELVVHDSGNERRYVMFIPAFVALAALAIDRALTRPARTDVWNPRIVCRSCWDSCWCWDTSWRAASPDRCSSPRSTLAI